MEELLERVAGVDIGRRELRVCVRVPDEVSGEPTEIIESWATTTPDLLNLVVWLRGLRVTHVAMESTGVYWKALYYLCEDDFTVLLVNAAHVKHLPGRKTDTIDAAWLAQLLGHGLLRASFVPPPEIRELRDLTRYRKVLIYERTRQVNRIHKTLDEAGIKLGIVAADIMGVSGRAMMRALIAGQRDPEALADLARGRMRNKIPPLRKALTARFRDHHAYLLDRMLAHAQALETDIADLDSRIDLALRPFTDLIDLLRGITGIETRSAQVILAEIGADMTVFPTGAHLAPGPRSAPANVTPAVNAAPGVPARARSGYAPPWSSAPAPPSAATTAPSPNATARSNTAAVTPKRSSLSPTRSCSPSTVSCPPTPPTTTPASPTSVPATTTTSAVRPSAAWKSSATRSSWRRHTPPHSHQPSLNVIF